MVARRQGVGGWSSGWESWRRLTWRGEGLGRSQVGRVPESVAFVCCKPRSQALFQLLH